jgi:hypothetical protein
MNLCIPLSQISPQHIYFTEKRKNIIIDGVFAKIVYSNSSVSLNGLFIYLNDAVNTSQCHPILPINETFLSNTDVRISNMVHTLCQLEEKILEYYKSVYGITKQPTYALKTQLITNPISCSSVARNFMCKPTPFSIMFGISDDTQTKHINIYSPFPCTGARECDNSHKRYDTGFSPCRIDVKHSPLAQTLPKTRSLPKFTEDDDKRSYITSKSTYHCLKISGVWENATSIGLTYKWIHSAPFM